MGAVRIPTMYYSETFKAQMVQKLTRRGGPSATELSRDVGVHQSTLSRWVRQAGKANGQGLPFNPTKPRSGLMTRRPQDWTAEEKLAAVVEAASLPDEELGAFLREKGLHEANVKQWRQTMLTGLGASKARSRKQSAEIRRIRELERELTRKEKALAEAAALLILKKKAHALWGDEDDITAPKKGRRS
jgi:transposase-like protein